MRMQANSPTGSRPQLPTVIDLWHIIRRAEIEHWQGESVKSRAPSGISVLWT